MTSGGLIITVMWIGVRGRLGPREMLSWAWWRSVCCDLTARRMACRRTSLETIDCFSDRSLKPSMYWSGFV